LLLALGWLAPLAAPAWAQAPADSTARPPLVTWHMIAPPPDRLQHAGLSFSLAAGVGIAAHAPWPGAGVALALGTAKELHDRRGGRFDPVDLGADLLGAVLGALATRSVLR
jgi:hypothetical protein